MTKTKFSQQLKNKDLDKRTIWELTANERQTLLASLRNVKLLAIDLDGTLFDQTGSITNFTKQAVLNMRMLGIKVVLCTGRTWCNILPYLDALELREANDYCITNTGAFVRNCKQGELIFDAGQKPEIYQELALLLRDYQAKYLSNEKIQDLRAVAYGGSHIYVVGTPNRALNEDNQLLNMPYIELDLNEDFAKQIKEPLGRVNLMGDPETIEQLYQEWQAVLSKFYCVRNIPISLEVLQKNAGKHQALKALCAYLNIELANTVAFGDGDNDSLNLQTAGLGVAMANAPLSVKNASDLIIWSNREAGVAQFMELIKQAYLSK